LCNSERIRAAPLQRRVSGYRQLEFKLVTSKLIVASGTKR
jgi:hypothetical protein